MKATRVYLLLALIGLALYSRSLFSEFVWDARAQLLIDTFLDAPGRWLDLVSLRVLSMDALDNNRPLQLLSLLIDRSIWGKNPLGFHLTSLLLHVGCTLLIFRLCKQMVGATHAAFAAALIFCVHPINCEAVAEVSYREDLLALFFVAAALNLATLFAPQNGRKTVLLGGAVVFSLVLAVCSKESAIVGPFLLTAYWLLFRKGEPRTGWLLLAASGFLAVGGFLGARFLLEPASTIFVAKPSYVGGSFLDTLLVTPRIWMAYVSKIFVPTGLCADYGLYSLRHIGLLLGVLGISALLCTQVLLSANSRVFAFGAFIFWLSLLPVSNFIPIYRPMADRFLYLPMSGVAVMLASLLARTRPKTSLLALAAVACIFAGITWKGQQVWANELNLWRDTVEKNPFSFSGQINLATAFLRNGRPEEALPAFEKAVRLSNCAESQAGYALALNAVGRTNEADAAVREAARMDSRYKHPEKLVQALTWEPDMAAKLQALLDRNRDL